MDGSGSGTGSSGGRSWREQLRSVAGRLLACAPSPACALCGAGNTTEGLCDGCHAELPWLPPDLCMRCAGKSIGMAIRSSAPGEPASGGGRVDTCGRCIADPPPFQSVVAALDYRFPVDAMIQRLKFAGDLWLVPVLAAPIVAAARQRPRPDWLLPMPLSGPRLVQRGFNQSSEIARTLARRTGIGLQTDVLRRGRDSPPQSGLPFTERQRNVRGAFVVDRPVAGQHLALVDDVLTTGATAAEATRALCSQGAVRVDVWVVARTVLHDRP